MRKILFAGASLFLFFQTVHAQNFSRLTRGEKGMYPTYVEFAAKDAPLFKKGVIIVQDMNGKTVSLSNTKLLRNETDALGYTHYRYQQTINGIPVEDAIYIVHEKGGKVMAQNGAWIESFPKNAARTATIGEAAALKNALQFIGASQYKWQSIDDEAFLKAETGDTKATFFPKATLVYYAGNDLKADNARLAFKFDIYAAEPLSRQYVYVDVQTGKVLGKKDLLQTVDQTGTAVTGYSGTQTINTTLSGGSYILRETGRGKGIQTFNMKKTTNYNKAVDFTDADNYWNNVNTAMDQYATDAHWGAEKTYDFYKNVFSRNSIDNNGFAIKSYVHYSRNYFNAFWDGSRMTYGDGSSLYVKKPLTALDVCGHEITHGLTSFTANLTYSNESGAMNEGFSDIFGTAIEWYSRPSQHDWLIGGDFYTIRSMSNPNAYSQPDTYKGTYWYTGTSDNGGVHTNSGVLNFWFYLLSAGGSGTNDKGTAYNVTGIGIDKAQAIAYRTLTTYLTASSNYSNARAYSIKSAEDLYGVGSAEATQTTNAWNAVGVTTSVFFAMSAPSNTTSTSLVSDVKVSRLYPNPVHNQFAVEFTDSKAGAKNIGVYTLSGEIVYQKKVSTVNGLNNVQISLPRLINGSYVVKINDVQAGVIIVK